MRDPEWEGVVDGEVCGLGPLADSIRVFLHWVPIKLDTSEALRLCVSCGDALAREVGVAVFFRVRIASLILLHVGKIRGQNCNVWAARTNFTFSSRLMAAPGYLSCWNCRLSPIKRHSSTYCVILGMWLRLEY